MEAQAIETVLTEPFGELPTILWLWKTSVTRQIRSEKAQRNTTIINEMTVFYTDKSMGTSRFWRQITDIDRRARQRFEAWNFKGGPSGRLRRDLCADGKAHQQNNGV